MRSTPLVVSACAVVSGALTNLALRRWPPPLPPRAEDGRRRQREGGEAGALCASRAVCQRPAASPGAALVCVRARCGAGPSSPLAAALTVTSPPLFPPSVPGLVWGPGPPSAGDGPRGPAMRPRASGAGCSAAPAAPLWRAQAAWPSHRLPRRPSSSFPGPATGSSPSSRSPSGLRSVLIPGAGNGLLSFLPVALWAQVRAQRICSISIATDLLLSCVVPPLPHPPPSYARTVRSCRCLPMHQAAYPARDLIVYRFPHVEVPAAATAAATAAAGRRRRPCHRWTAAVKLRADGGWGGAEGAPPPKELFLSF